MQPAMRVVCVLRAPDLGCFLMTVSLPLPLAGYAASPSVPARQPGLVDSKTCATGRDGCPSPLLSMG